MCTHTHIYIYLDKINHNNSINKTCDYSIVFECVWLEQYYVSKWTKIL